MAERRFHLAHDARDRRVVAACLQAALATARREVVLRVIEEVLELDGDLAPRPLEAEGLARLHAWLRAGRPVACSSVLAALDLTPVRPGGSDLRH